MNDALASIIRGQLRPAVNMGQMLVAEAVDAFEMAALGAAGHDFAHHWYDVQGRERSRDTAPAAALAACTSTCRGCSLVAKTRVTDHREVVLSAEFTNDQRRSHTARLQHNDLAQKWADVRAGAGAAATALALGVMAQCLRTDARLTYVDAGAAEALSALAGAPVPPTSPPPSPPPPQRPVLAPVAPMEEAPKRARVEEAAPARVEEAAREAELAELRARDEQRGKERAEYERAVVELSSAEYKLECESATSEARWRELVSERAALEGANSELAALKGERASVDYQRVCEVKASEERLAMLAKTTAELDEVNKQRKAAVAELLAAAATIEHQKHELKLLHEQRARLANELVEARSLQQQSERGSKDAAATVADEVERVRKAAEAERDAYESRADARLLRAAAEHAAEVQRLRLELVNMPREGGQVARLTQERDAMTRMYREAGLAVESLGAEVRALEAERAQNVDSMRAQLAGMQPRVAALEAEREGMLAQVDKLSEELDLEKAARKLEVDRLQAKLERKSDAAKLAALAKERDDALEQRAADAQAMRGAADQLAAGRAERFKLGAQAAEAAARAAHVERELAKAAEVLSLREGVVRQVIAERDAALALVREHEDGGPAAAQARREAKHRLDLFIFAELRESAAAAVEAAPHDAAGEELMAAVLEG